MVRPTARDCMPESRMWMKKADLIIKYLLHFLFFLSVVIYFLGSQKLAMQRAFFSKYKNCQYIDKDGLACINLIFVVVV